MTRSRKAVTLAAALLACAPATAPAQAPARTTTSAAVEVPPIRFRSRTLANGLRVLAARDTTAPTVAIQVAYRVGSKDDPQGRSGFAHLFEHLMYKRTANMRDEQMDRLTEDVGGFNNANTWDDYTNYYEVVPSNYLETLLWAEAERMGSLQVDSGSFASERDVVKEEYRARVLAPPYGRLFYQLMAQHSFTTHPYKRPGIGSIEELDAATLEDVRRFHATFYRPDNATLVVVGDFDDAQLDDWVDRYFGPLKAPDTPLPRVTAKEPARTAERKLVEHAPNVPLPAVLHTYLVPSASSADGPALRVADAILALGESSRLRHALTYQQQVAADVVQFAALQQDAGLFISGAIVAGGKTAEQADRALRAELRRMQTAPVTAAELARAKNQLVTAALRERETNEGRSLALVQAEALQGDAARANDDVARLQAVTAADVQRVMRTYITDANRLVIHYLPEPADAAKPEAAKPEAAKPEGAR